LNDGCSPRPRVETVPAWTISAEGRRLIPIDGMRDVADVQVTREKQIGVDLAGRAPSPGAAAEQPPLVDTRNG
jgi:hypothetical protein